MSGKRFSGLERMNTAEFEAAVTRTTATLDKYPVKYCFPKNIRSKDSFGDVDVYVHADEPTVCRIVAELLFLDTSRQFNSFDSIRKVDPNGNVFGKVGNQIFLKTRNMDSDKPIMIDLNLCEKHEVEFKSLYHSYGHASLLIDTLASWLNMYWKDNGLYLRINKQHKVLITSNIETAMDILWLDASVFDFGSEGFKHPHNLFAWIVASKFFDSDVIPFFGGGVTKTMSESSVTFRSINSSALKHIQKQIGDGGLLNEGTLTYRLEESASIKGIQLSKLSKGARQEYEAYSDEQGLDPVIVVSKGHLSLDLKRGQTAEFEYDVKRVGDKYSVNNDGRKLSNQTAEDVKKLFSHSNLLQELFMHI